MNTSESSQARPTPKFKQGDTFCLSQEGITYHFSGAGIAYFAEEYAARIFVVEQWYDHNIAQKNNDDPHGHPQFNELTAQGTCLYQINSPYSLLGPFVIESHIVYVPRPVPKFKIGDTFILNEENFGTEYEGKLFTVTHWYDHYIPYEWWKQHPDDDPHGDPYFDVDASCGMMCLYETTFPETNLYDWDMVYVPPSERHKYQYTSDPREL